MSSLPRRPAPTSLRVERLEDRLTPATLLGLTAANSLLRFDSATPDVTTAVAVTGLNADETLVGIDHRPATGVLYGVTSQNRLVTLTVSGTTATVGTAVNLVADTSDETNPFAALSGTSFGVDFNPAADRLRVVSDTGQSLRINVNGTVFTDTDLNPGAPDVVAAAYTNNFAGTPTTTLYALDDATDSLVTVNPPNDGVVAPVGAGLGGGVNVTAASGFDIVTTGGPTARTNTAYAVLTQGSSVGLYTIDLTTGTATLVGTIGAGSTPLVGLAAVPVGTLNFGVDSYPVAENGGTATVTVTRTGGSAGVVSVDYASGGGNATPGADYAAVAGTLTWADGDTAAKTFTVSVLDDLLAEGVEAAVIGLSNLTGGAVIGPRGAASVAIRDNESSTVILYAVSNNPATLTEFDAANPNVARRTTPLTGLNEGDVVKGIDVRPASGALFALVVNGSTSRLAVINPLTGTVAPLAPLTADPADATNPFTALTGDDFGFDFNPTNDRLRITSDAGDNLLVNPLNGRVTTQTVLNPGTPHVVGSAYTNSFAGAGSTTLYNIDSVSGQLLRQNPPADGTLVPVGSLGVTALDALGFEIVANGNQGFAALRAPTISLAGLHVVDLNTGAASRVGSIGTRGLSVEGLASQTVNDLNLTPDEKLINRLYLDLLGRNASGAELQSLTAFLFLGASRTEVVNSIQSTGEYRAKVVTDLYQRFLRRNPGVDEVNAALPFIGIAGATAYSALLVGTGEYFAVNGGTNDAFVTAAYRDVLGRVPTDAERATTLGQLAGGTSRIQVAQGLLGGNESLGRQVDRLYSFYLLRTPAAAERTTGINFLRATGRSEGLALALLATQEYANLYRVA